MEYGVLQQHWTGTFYQSSEGVIPLMIVQYCFFFLFSVVNIFQAMSADLTNALTYAKFTLVEEYCIRWTNYFIKALNYSKKFKLYFQLSADVDKF
jgi:hypothetical protein